MCLNVCMEARDLACTLGALRSGVVCGNHQPC